MKVQLDQHSRYESEEKWWLVMDMHGFIAFEDFSNSDDKNVNAGDPQNVLMKINFIGGFAGQTNVQQWPKWSGNPKFSPNALIFIKVSRLAPFFQFLLPSNRAALPDLYSCWFLWPWVSIVIRVRGIVCAMHRPLFRSSTIDRVWRYMVSTLTVIVIISEVLDTETSIDLATLTQLYNNNIGGNGQVIIPLTASSVVRSECDKRIRKSTLSLLAQKVIQTKHFW